MAFIIHIGCVETPRPTVGNTVSSTTPFIAHCLMRVCTGGRGTLNPFRQVDRRLPGKRNSHFHGARPVLSNHLSMMKWIRTSRLSIKNSLCTGGCGRRGGRRRDPAGCCATPQSSPSSSAFLYRGTSLIRNSASLGLCIWPYGGPRGGVPFLMSEVPLYRGPWSARLEEKEPSRMLCNAPICSAAHARTETGYAQAKISNPGTWIRKTLNPKP